MYVYNTLDQAQIDERVSQFRGQMARFLKGRLSEEDFRPLRLQNGLYLQRHAPMLRVAIPYGVLSSRQMRLLAHIARQYDRGYGHFTTRCNVQFNWVRLEDAPDILAELATVQMHAIQTSGNCVRNITCDAQAGVAHDEIFDVRPDCELVRQWSIDAPEFLYLPRKFKIAFNGSQQDRAALRFYDIGAQATRNDAGQPGFTLYAGGGLGRTPLLGQCVREFLPRQALLTYFEAILRVYNRYGRRGNKYKARLKILLKDLGLARFREEVENEWQLAGQEADGPAPLSPARIEAMENFFRTPAGSVPASCQSHALNSPRDAMAGESHPDFARWRARNVAPHRAAEKALVTLSLKAPGIPPGDATAAQMLAVADLADAFSAGEIRVTHEQNLLLPHVHQSQLEPLWHQARAHGLATPNIGLLSDMVCCPGGDFCSLANARSIPIAQAIQERFADLDRLFDLGPIELNISGCVNSCGHHHMGHIGILGVDKNQQEWYQISLGGREGSPARIGRVIGPAVAADQVATVIEKLLGVYVSHRQPDERFIDALERLGTAPFKAAVYGAAHD